MIATSARMTVWPDETGCALLILIIERSVVDTSGAGIPRMPPTQCAARRILPGRPVGGAA
jgi:hypothetical protein